MHVIIKKWGNSASIRIPTTIMQATHLQLNQSVDIREENGCIIIKPIKQKKLSLKKLLDNITPDNLHNEIDFGPPTGKEHL